MWIWWLLLGSLSLYHPGLRYCWLWADQAPGATWPAPLLWCSAQPPAQPQLLLALPLSHPPPAECKPNTHYNWFLISETAGLGLSVWGMVMISWVCSLDNNVAACNSFSTLGKCAGYFKDTEHYTLFTKQYRWCDLVFKGKSEIVCTQLLLLLFTYMCAFCAYSFLSWTSGPLLSNDVINI